MHLLPRLLALFVVVAEAIVAAPTAQVIHLWPNGAPGFESRKDEPEQAKDYWVKNIHNPSVTVFRPAEGTANGCAVIVAPGGGFRELVFHAEGEQAADALTKLGVTVFVLKYRLSQQLFSPYTIAHVRQDAYRAVRLVRARAREFGIDPHRVGMLGFSAGGAVVLMIGFDRGDGDPHAADAIDRQNGRPDFVMMVYPGGNVPKVIPADAPPAFLICADDDEYGCDKVTLEVVTKYREARVPVELHLIARGKHAFNMGDRSEFLAIRHWPDRMADWLHDRGLLNQR